MSSVNRPTSKYGDIAIYHERSWIDRKAGVPIRRRMWKGRVPHPFQNEVAYSLRPINASQERGFTPPRKKRGRKSKQIEKQI